MTTIVNNPPSNDSGGGMGMIVGLFLLVLVIALFFMYGIPALRQVRFGNPQINIPNEIDINVNQQGE